MRFLSLGDRFGVPYDNNFFPTDEIISDLESKISEIETEEQNHIRSDVANIIKNSKRSYKLSPMDKFIMKLFRKTRFFVKNNSDKLFTSKADKGNVTVILDRNTYVSKAKILLSDTETYVRVEKDPTITYQSKFNDLIKFWFSKKYINEIQKKRLVCETGTIPKFYALPKIHKPNVPLRPIVSAVTSPSYKLSRFYQDILKNITGKKSSYVKNSNDFADKIRKLSIPENYKLVSLDVTSLFTNIPLNLVIALISKKWSEIKVHTKLPKKQFLDGIKLIFEYSHFSFDNQFYKQTFGTPMGAPLSCVLADLIMEMLEEKQLPKLGFPVPFFFRYVDDIITCLPANRINETMSVFNKFHPRLQFTVEVENEARSISFLDTLVTVTDESKCKINWFRKPTWSGRVLNYHSHHSNNQKIAMVYNLVDKAILLADKEYHSDNIKLVKRTLENNLYPRDFVDLHVKKRCDKIKIISTEVPLYTDQESSRITVALPYVKNVDFKLQRTLKKYGMKAIFYNSNKTNCNFDKLKDKDPTVNKSNAVYSIPCNNCDKIYIGQTKRYIKKRVYEHQYNKKLHPSKYTSLTKHMMNFDHQIAYDKVKVVRHERNYKKRLVHEMTNILKSKNAMNERTDVDGLNVIYHGCLRS